jgi:uncharacterized membrane protein
MSKLIALVYQEEEQYSQQIVTPPEVGAGPPMLGDSTPVLDPEPYKAQGALKDIQERAKEAGVKLEDAVILFKTPRGEVKIKQTEDLTAAKGARRGVFWGLLAGIILGGPIAGLLVGLGIGAGIGHKVDHGIDDKFLKNVTEGLTLNKSAVLIMVKDEDAEKAVAYLKTFDTEMHVADLNDAAAEVAEKAAEDDAVSEAVEAEYQID